MHPATATWIVHLLRAGIDPVCHDRFDADEKNLRASLENGLPYHVGIDLIMRADRMASIAFRRAAARQCVSVSFQFVDGDTIEAEALARLHLRVARLAILIQAVIECDDRIAGLRPDVLTPIVNILDNLVDWLDAPTFTRAGTRAILGLS